MLQPKELSIFGIVSFNHHDKVRTGQFKLRRGFQDQVVDVDSRVDSSSVINKVEQCDNRHGGYQRQCQNEPEPSHSFGVTTQVQRGLDAE